jgi:hypothetical protein
MNRNIALGGPKNGLYLDAAQAAQNGYDSLIDWNVETDEKAWLHVTSTDDIPAEFVDEQENNDV